MQFEEKTPSENPPKDKNYTKPAIIHELELETRAGSVVPDSSGTDPLNLVGLSPGISEGP